MLEIKPESLDPRETDILFQDSPDEGLPECICSRCKQQIGEDELAIRLFINEGRDGEYRYCERCISQ
ncbi:MAG: hypothetical protein SCARUB_01292 [Candidatus Scalindua rubra]|uniref:Uncharacterized protein n=1 Tax=Candidatus Scalindua rubra TaxID=1872076 RepID=A0A1E3XD85_9BACT|nr:MAG: hypothetical protein SCARUB_01292 [Candidatus Scalindua rubra]